MIVIYKSKSTNQGGHIEKKTNRKKMRNFPKKFRSQKTQKRPGFHLVQKLRVRVTEVNLASRTCHVELIKQ